MRFVNTFTFASVAFLSIFSGSVLACKCHNPDGSIAWYVLSPPIARNIQGNQTDAHTQ